MEENVQVLLSGEDKTLVASRQSGGLRIGTHCQRGTNAIKKGPMRLRNTLSEGSIDMISLQLCRKGAGDFLEGNLNSRDDRGPCRTAAWRSRYVKGDILKFSQGGTLPSNPKHSRMIRPIDLVAIRGSTNYYDFSNLLTPFKVCKPHSTPLGNCSGALIY